MTGLYWLTAEERQKWGTNLYNAKSDFGILLMNDETCFKRPIFTESFNMLFYCRTSAIWQKIPAHANL